MDDATKIEFETEPCGRCGGSGTYSYTQRWGTTCFDCGVKPYIPGTGRRLTKRGKAAREYFRSLLPSKTVGELVSGDRIRLGASTGWATVVALAPPSAFRLDKDGNRIVEDTLDIQCLKLTYAGLPVSYRVRVLPTVEQRAEAYRQALEYQATLTKGGVPAKRRGVRKKT